MSDFKTLILFADALCLARDVLVHKDDSTVFAISAVTTIKLADGVIAMHARIEELEKELEGAKIDADNNLWCGVE